jgi:hypothetical protein
VPYNGGQNATPAFPPRDFEPWAKALEALRPWGDRMAVRNLIEGWAAAVADTGHAEAVAEELQKIGKADPEADADILARAAFYMLQSVLSGREATNWSLLDLYSAAAIRPRTRRRYRASKAEPQARQRLADRWFELRQYHLDVAELVGAGKSVAAARQAIRRRRKAQSIPPSRHMSRVEAMIALAAGTDDDALHDGGDERAAPRHGLSNRPSLSERS